MSSFHFNVSMDRRPQNAWLFTMKLASGITAADIGKAVALDTSAANQVKLAGAGDRIFGRLEVYEESGLGTVALKFIETLPVVTGATFAVGDTAIGASDTVKGQVTPRRNAGDTANEADPNQNLVVEVRTGLVVVAKL